MTAIIIIAALLVVPILAIIEEWDRKRAERMHEEELSQQIAKQALIDEHEMHRRQFRAKWCGLTAQEAVRKEREL